MTAHVVDGMSNAAYHAHGALGSTSLKTLATKTPAHYKHAQANTEHKQAYDIGTAAHSLILEQDESGIVELKYPDYKSKAAQTAKADAYAEGKTPLLTKELAQVRAIRDAVMDHPRASELFNGHRAEASVFWVEDGIELKCRPDAWHPGSLVDLKTLLSADPNEFGKVAADYGYYQSAAHYQDGVEALTGERLPFLFVLAEKTAPYLVSVRELDDMALEYGRAMNDRAKRIYRECVANDRWPGYPDGEPVSLPAYATYKLDDLLGLNIETEIVIR